MGSTQGTEDTTAGHRRGAPRAPFFRSAGRARILRFVCVGLLASALQVALLALLTRHGWGVLLANVVAFLLSAQVNFALSLTFTWRDRAPGSAIGRRWLLFHGSIAGTAVLNQVVFILARAVLPTLLASAAGSAVAALGNYLLGDRLVFRRRQRRLLNLLPQDEDHAAA